MLIEVEEAQMATLGPTHESYSTTKHNLALRYSDIKDYDTSIKLLKEVEEAQMATLGPTHKSYLLKTKHTLALCYSFIKDFDTSIKLLIEVEEAEIGNTWTNS